MATENKITLERTYIIPLRTEWLKAPMHKRAKKAVRAVREFLMQHMKAEMKDVKIERWLNTLLWERGIKKPVAKVKVKVTKNDKGIVRAELAELPEYAKKIEAKLKAKESKSKKEEKKEEKAEKKEHEIKEEEKKAEEQAKEEIKKEEDEKEKKMEEKIIDKKVKPEEKAHVPRDEHMHVKTKIMRTD